MKVYITLLLFIGLFTGCTWKTSIDSMAAKVSGIQISLPVPDSYVISSNASSYNISGSCEDEGSTITLSGAASGTTTCTAGTWSTTLDLSGAPDGQVLVQAQYTRADGQVVSASTKYIKDTTPPSLMLTNFTGGELVSGLALHNITWTATDNRPLPSQPIKIEYSTNNGTSWSSIVNATGNTSTYAWMAPLIDSADCLIRVTAKDGAGNTSQAVSAAVFEMDSSPPTLSLDSLDGGQFVMGGSTTTEILWSVSDVNLDTNSIAVSYSKDNGATWINLASNLSASPGVYVWPLVPSDDLATYRVRVTAQDTLGHTAEVYSSSPFTVDSTIPVINSLVLNGNIPTAGGNVLGYALGATDNFNVISAWRFSATNDFTLSEWHTEKPTNFTFPYSIGVSEATLYAQVRDAAGNVSAPLSSNKVTITMGMPPTLIITYPTESNAFTTGGQLVHISWKATINSTNPLLPDGVTVSYSLDNGITSVPWPGGAGEGLSPLQNGSCTLDLDATGCVDLSLPMSLANEKFSIIVNVRDEASNSSAVISTPQNMTGLKLLAGKNSSVLGQTGLAFSLDYLGAVARDPLNGDLLISQLCQIVVLKASSGIMEKWAGSASQCWHEGDGGNLADVRFESANRWAGGGGAANIVFDSQRNVYWASKRGIWKYTRATGTAEVYVGAMTMPYSNANGTARRSFSCESVSGANLCTQASYLEIGVDDTLYFAVDSQGDPFARKLYKVNPDQTVSLVAGMKGPSLPAPSAGAMANAVNFRSFTVVPDKTNHVDRVFGIGWGGPSCTVDTMCSQNGLWEVLADGTVVLTSASVAPAQSTNLTRYIPSRKAVGYMQTGPCRVAFINPLDPLEVIPSMSYPTDDCDISDVADGTEKGLYYTNTAFTNLYFTSSNNTPVIYSGNVANAGDGGLAILSQVRSPRQVTMGSDGVYYFVDLGNSSLRKVLTNGNIQTIRNVGSPYSLSLSNGTSSTVYVVDAGDSDSLGIGAKVIADINDINAGSQFFAAPWGSKPVCTVQDTSTNAKTELTTGGPGAPGFYSAAVAVDGLNTYIFYMALQGDDTRKTTIKKIASDMSMTTVAGNSSAPFTPTLGSAYNQPVLTSSAGETSCNGCGDLSRSGIKVADGVIFKVEADGSLYMVDSTVGTNTWDRIATGLDSTFALNPVTKDVYYLKGRALYRKPYVGGEVLVADFTGALKSPMIQNFDLVKPNTVILVDGDSIYTYTNVLSIP